MRGPTWFPSLFIMCCCNVLYFLHRAVFLIHSALGTVLSSYLNLDMKASDHLKAFCMPPLEGHFAMDP